MDQYLFYDFPGWWLYITVAVVGSTALILTVVGIMRLKRGKEHSHMKQDEILTNKIKLK